MSEPSESSPEPPVSQRFVVDVANMTDEEINEAAKTIGDWFRDQIAGHNSSPSPKRDR